MQNSNSVINLLTYIICYATEHRTALTTLRLVKFIYLADLYHARHNNGQTFTNFPWAFVHYGPYCSEAMNSIEEAVSVGAIAKNVYQSQYGNDTKDYALFVFCISGLEDPDLAATLSIVREAYKG